MSQLFLGQDTKYLDVRRELKGYWIIKDIDGYGLMDDTMKMVLPCKYRYVDVEENGILFQNEDYTMQRLNFDHSIKDDFVCAEIAQLTYSTDKLDKKGNAMTAMASCKTYKVDGEMCDHYGLMDAAGHPLTKPNYEEIVAVSENLYLCKTNTDGILINGRGEKVNK